MSESVKKVPKKEPDAEEVRRRWRGLIAWLLLGLAMLWLWQSAIEGLRVTTIPYSAFKAHLDRGEVVEALIKNDVIEGEIDPKEETAPGAAEAEPEEEETPTDPFRFRTVRVEDPNLVEELDAAGVQYVGERPSVLSQFLVAWFIPIALIVLLWMFMARRMREAAGSALSLGRNKAKIVADTDTGVSFADVAGCDEAKAELQEVVQFLREPARYEALGAKIPKGVLLVGPPGTGKTLVARAVAGEARVPFYQMSGSDFVEMFVGVGAARVRDLFEQATKQAPCIVFIDEIDAIGRTRGTHVGVVNDEREQTLNQLLVEMDGFDSNRGVILLAATNRPDVLDRALLRPGRFDRQVVLDAPDVEGRKAILAVHMRNKPVDDGVDLAAVARVTPGFSGADLANAVNEAALLAARRDAKALTQHDLEEAVEKVVAGPERKSRRLTDAERRRVAYHEVGHALVAHCSPHADPVHKISIVPRGKAALGYTLQLPTDELYLVTRSQLLDRIRAALGGRAAEDVVFAEVSSGAENDLEKATAMARQMITMLGMSDKIGLAHVARRTNPYLPGAASLEGTADCSPQTAREIDEEVRELLARAYREAKQILVERRETLEHAAAELLEHETLDASTFLAIAGERGNHVRP